MLNYLYLNLNFPNFHKDFYFRLLNNTLLLNYQISKFDQNIDPRCSYCIAKTTPTVSEKENAFHLFTQCDNMTSLREVITNDNLFHTPINNTDFILGGTGQRPCETYLKNFLILILCGHQIKLRGGRFQLWRTSCTWLVLAEVDGLAILPPPDNVWLRAACRHALQA